MALVVKNPPANAGDARDSGLIPELGRSPGGGNCKLLIFLPGKFHGQRSLADYSPWGHKELDTTDELSARARAHTHTHTHTQMVFACEIYTFLLDISLREQPSNTGVLETSGLFQRVPHLSFCLVVLDSGQNTFYFITAFCPHRRSFFFLP